MSEAKINEIPLIPGFDHATVREQFGDEVCYLVDGVTKLEKVDYGAAAEPETFRKMLVATGNDVRVMSIKLADRLHNMRTLGVMRPEKQVRIAKVTHDVLIPLAERLDTEPWMGARPCTPDMLPVIGRAPRHSNLFFAFGHAHHGLTLAAVTGRLVAEIMTGEAPLVDPAPYSPERFA